MFTNSFSTNPFMKPIYSSLPPNLQHETTTVFNIQINAQYHVQNGSITRLTQFVKLVGLNSLSIISLDSFWALSRFPKILAANIWSSIGLDTRDPGREPRTVIIRFHMDEISTPGNFLCSFFGALLKLKRTRHSGSEWGEGHCDQIAPPLKVCSWVLV